MDQHNDGQLSWPEMAIGMGFDKSIEPSEGFQLADLDGSGALSWSEFRRADALR